MNAEQLRTLQPALRGWLNRFRVCFERQKTFEQFRCYVVGTLTDLKRKSIEPIALAVGVPVRTLQELLAFFVWDQARMDRLLSQMAANRPGAEAGGFVVLDATGHP
jgi:SRSO17 transposase